MKKLLCIIMLFLLIGTMGIVSGATFENINENEVSSYFLNHNFDCGGASGGSAYNSLGGIVVRDIQHWDSSPPAILYNSQDEAYQGWTVTDKNIPSGSTTFTLSISGNTISTGTITYNLLYNSEGNPSHMNVWMEFDNWDSKGYTGQQSLTLTYNSANINGLRVGGTYRGSITPPSDNWGMYFIFSIAYSRYNGGYIIINEDYYWKNNIKIYPNDGELPSSFNVLIDRFDSYVSVVHIYTESFDYINDYSLNDIDTTTYEYPIFVDIKNSNEVWYNNTYYANLGGNEYFMFTTDRTEATINQWINSTLTELSGVPYYNSVQYQVKNENGDYLDFADYSLDGSQWKKYIMENSSWINVDEEDIFSFDTRISEAGDIEIICNVFSVESYWPTLLFSQTNVVTIEESGLYGKFVVMGIGEDSGSILLTDCIITREDNSEEIYNSTDGSLLTVHTSDNTLMFKYYTIELSSSLYQDLEINHVFLSLPMLVLQYKMSPTWYPDEDESWLNFHVVDENDIDLSGVNIRLNGGIYTATTNNFGLAGFPVPNNATYTYTLSKEEYNTVSGSIDITTENELIEIVLYPSTIVTPTTTTPTGERPSIIDNIISIFTTMGMSDSDARIFAGLFLTAIGFMVGARVLAKSKMAVFSGIAGGICGFVGSVALGLFPFWIFIATIFFMGAIVVIIIFRK